MKEFSERLSAFLLPYQIKNHRNLLLFSIVGNSAHNGRRRSFNKKKKHFFCVTTARLKILTIFHGQLFNDLYFFFRAFGVWTSSRTMLVFLMSMLLFLLVSSASAADTCPGEPRCTCKWSGGKNTVDCSNAGMFKFKS